MPTVDIYNAEGQVVGSMELSDKVFGVEGKRRRNARGSS